MLVACCVPLLLLFVMPSPAPHILFVMARNAPWGIIMIGSGEFFLLCALFFSPKRKSVSINFHFPGPWLEKEGFMKGKFVDR